jgi:hypothetical protein
MPIALGDKLGHYGILAPIGGGYRSLEQSRGELVDKYADIWAFSLVPHELLAGEGESSRRSSRTVAVELTGGSCGHLHRLG